MQRPRRTSEFHEEPGTSKRQSRIPQRGTVSSGLTPCVSGTAQKVLLRHTGSVTHTGSVNRGRTKPTPQKTPLKSARVLFTAEKHAAGTALHNDKKWIQDKSQQLVEYFKNSSMAIPGLPMEFFSKPNCLKQLTIKQFVAIINYFLQFICGNRFTVGTTNYVEDIINILQKLDYPYAVNKSWLKTPNTTHSFGYVIVLFDFLMDFAPLSENVFELQESQTTEVNEDGTELEQDKEFKSKLLTNCQKSFKLWDKQLTDEFEQLKIQTADFIVKKKYNIDGLAALDKEIELISVKYEEIKEQRPHVDCNDENYAVQLENKVKNLQNQFEELCESYTVDDKQLEQILTKREYLAQDIAQSEENIKSYQKTIGEQICNVEERDNYLQNILLLRQEFQTCLNSVNDLNSLDYEKVIQITKYKNKISQEIENLNSSLFELVCSVPQQGSPNSMDLTLMPNLENWQHVETQLKLLTSELEERLLLAKEKHEMLTSEIEKQSFLKGIIEPKYLMKKDLLEKLLKEQKEYEEKSLKKLQELHIEDQKCENELISLESETKSVRNALKEAECELKEWEQKNEDTLSRAEIEHASLLEKRKAKNEAIKKELDEGLKLLKEIEKE